MDFRIITNGHVNGNGHVDWPLVKTTILANLDVAAEYQRLGIEFTKPSANGKGWRECRAAGRKDDVPSAAVNVKTGYYHDSGGEGLTLSLWDFALRFGEYGRWIDVMTFFADRASVKIGDVKPGRGGKIREAEYLYRNANGSVAYCVFRYRLPTGKKTFSQHPPDGHGGWKYGDGCMDNVRPVPYRLPELLASDPAEEPVWVVEGEKDAERLASLGLVATTNHQGSGNTDGTWPMFLDYFRAREVYVLPDNDATGRKHGWKVATYLNGVARLVKVVDLPGLSSKGDVSDWLDAGNDLDDLGRVANQAPIFDPEAKETIEDEPDPESNGKVLIVWASAIKTRPVEWLWNNRIPLGKLTTFAGVGGLGKTFVLCDLASRISAELEFPFSNGEYAEQGRVLFISGEDEPEDTLVPRMIEMGADLNRIAFLSTEALDRFQMADIETMDQMVVQMGDVRMVAIDPPTAYLGGVDDHKNAELRSLLSPLRSWASRHRCALIFNTHVNKPQGSKVEAMMRVMGSVAWVNAVRSAHMFAKDPHDPLRRLFIGMKNNLGQEAQGLSYRIVKTPTLAKVEWLGTVDTTADEALNQDRKKPRFANAREFLIDLYGRKLEWPSAEFWAEVKENDITKYALDEAKAALGVPRARRTIGAGGDVTYVFWVPPDWEYLPQKVD